MTEREEGRERGRGRGGEREGGGERERQREKKGNLKGVNKVLKGVGVKGVGVCGCSCAPSSPPLYICECMCASEKTCANVAFMHVCMQVTMHTSTS